MPYLILIVEDEAPQAEALRYNLDKAGFDVAVAVSGERALNAIDKKTPDVVIVDWMLPEHSGVELCKILRSRPETKRIPIIMLTARGEESDKVLGLDAGADDYVVKPYSPREMIARVRALLRRSSLDDAPETLTYAGVDIDTETHKVTRRGNAVHLGPIEFKLLKALMKKPGKVYSRDKLLDRVWGRDINVEDRTVDVHIRRLRQALNADGGPDLIRTVRGAGYAMDDPTD